MGVYTSTSFAAAVSLLVSVLRSESVLPGFHSSAITIPASRLLVTFQQLQTIHTMLSSARGRLAHNVFLASRVARTRSLASVSSSSPINPNSVGPFQVFDRNVKRMQKDRSAERDGGNRSRTVDYVRDEVADRLIERMQVRNVQRRSF